MLPVFVFLLAALTGTGQQHHRVVRWTVVIRTGSEKIKEVLYDVTDSSVIVMLHGPRKHYSEYLFRDIRKIKLRTRQAMDGMYVIGAAAGIAVGVATAFAVLDVKDRTGEPAGYAGLVGGMGGTVIGGIVGGALGPPILGALFSRKYIVRHYAASYAELAAKLRPVSIRGQQSDADH